MSSCITNVINLSVHCLILEVTEIFLQLFSQKKKLLLKQFNAADSK
jgi:hypothetical protein